jgi:hypothetical protein
MQARLDSAVSASLEIEFLPSLKAEKNVHGQALLYTIGRQANSDLMAID